MIGQQELPLDRRLLVAGAGLAGVVLGWILLVTVFGGGSEGTPIASRSADPTAGTSPSTTSTSAPPQDTYIPPTRDPFRQNVTVPKAGASGQATAQGSAAAPIQAAPIQAAPVTTTRPATAGDRGKASLELKSIASDASGALRATITVDGQSYNPATGESFAHGYRLERIDGTCVEVAAQTTRAQMCLVTTS